MKLAVLLTVLSYWTQVQGHLRMTFPAARQYALDFLDNVRTSPPCGNMVYKDGDPITTIETGKTVTATWHNAYPHTGGIRFELLNATSGEIIQKLTGDGYQYTNDSTVQSHDLTFTDDHLCDHCVLRIIRQAGEWQGGVDGYLFWSCADVKIMNSSEKCYSGKCLNRGTCEAASGSCTCLKTYLGDRCQYKNDCEDESDCNSNGICHDLQSTFYPTKVCYCNEGKMGRFCSKDSPVTKAVMTSDELKDHYHSELFADPKFKLYWKLIGDNKDEIEFVVQVKTNTWVALGWRPDSVTATCRSFPTNTGTGTGTPEPESGPTGEPEGTPEATPESTPETTPEGTTAASRKRRDAQFKVVGNVVRRIRRETERNIIKELCMAGNKTEAREWAIRNYNADPSATAEPEPEPEATATPEPEGTPEPAPEGTPEGGSSNLHAMDCQDMIIISAEGNRHRVLDSYTRDRSTPQPDSFYGGSDDLTAAAAKMEDGMLHAVFRRKTMSMDPADHPLKDGNNLFVWARGQDPVRFYHWPLSGLERCQASNYDFYKINELKYHGTKNTQRGTRTINVYENPNSSEEEVSGSHSIPSGCTGAACNYKADWSYRKELGVVQFTIAAKVELQKWAAIGFSNDQNMVDSDAIIMWMDSATSPPTISDRFIDAKSSAGVVADSTQNSEVIEGSYNNGMMTVTFKRKLNTEDSKDFSLDQCRYFLYAWGGDASGSTLGYHNSDREASTKKICIASGSPRVALSSVLGLITIVCGIVLPRLTLQ